MTLRYIAWQKQSAPIRIYKIIQMNSQFHFDGVKREVSEIKYPVLNHLKICCKQ